MSSQYERKEDNPRMSPIKRIPFVIKPAVADPATAIIVPPVTTDHKKFRFLSFAEGLKKQHDEGIAFTAENEWKEPACVIVDYLPGETLNTDEWFFGLQRTDKFSPYSAFQHSIGGQLGRKWDATMHGWRYPAVVYNMNKVMAEIEEVKKGLQRYKHIPGYYGDVSNYISAVQMTPLCAQMLQMKKAMEARWEGLQTASDSNIVISDFSDVPYMDHQINGIEFMASHDSICGDAMGTGKTRQGLNVAWKLYNDENTGIKRCIVVCPTGARRVWLNQAREYMKNRMIPIMIGGVWENRIDLLAPIYPIKQTDENGEQFTPMPIYIINYEKARAHPVELKILCEDGLLILDEAHKIKAMSSKVTKVILDLKPLRKIELTGTPVMNTPVDAYSLVSYVRPGLLGRSYDEFFNYFCYREQGTYKVKYRNLEEMNARIRPFFIRRNKDVLHDLPEKMFVREFESLQLGPEQRKHYNEMALKYMTEIEGLDEENVVVYASNVMVRIGKLLEICDGFVRPAGERAEWIADAVKPKVVREILEQELNNGRKVVVWSRLLPPLEMLQTDLAEYHPVVLHGGVPEHLRGSGPLDTDKDRTIVGRFWTDPKVRVLLGQIQTGGQAIDLTCADLCLFYNHWWGPGLNEQAEDRLHRKGQKNPVTVIPLVTGNTIEENYFASEYDDGTGETVEGLLYQKKAWKDAVVEGYDSGLSKANILKWIRRSIQ